MASPKHGKRQTGKGEKPSDRWAVPLCRDCHLDGPEAQHRGEERFWRRVGVDPLALAATLHAQFERRRSRTPEQREKVVRRARKILRKRKPMMEPGLEAEFVQEKGAPWRKVSRAKDPELFRYRWGGGRPLQGRAFPKVHRPMKSNR